MVKNLSVNAEDRFDPWVGKIPWRRAQQPISVFLPGESHGQRILAGYSPWGSKESDMTERLSTHTQANVSKKKKKIAFSNNVKLSRNERNVETDYICFI